MRVFLDLKNERQKTYYESSRYGPKYKIGEEMLVFTDNEINLKSADRTQAVNEINPLIDTNEASENEARDSESKNPEGQKIRRHKTVAQAFAE